MAALPEAGPEPVPLSDWVVPCPFEHSGAVEVPDADDLRALFPGAEPEPTAAPLVPTDPCTGIRPGVRMTSPAGCTFNFIFRGVKDGKLYIGSAGHCFNRVGEPVETGPLKVIGHVAYFRNGGIGSDFGLVEILPQHYDKVNATICHWGGPTGVFTARGGQVVRHYGNGMIYGSTSVTRARTAWAAGWGANDWAAMGASAGGDSGSPVRIDAGPAVGILTHGIGIGVSAPAGQFFGTRIQRAIDMARNEAGLEVELVTAPVA